MNMKIWYLKTKENEIKYHIFYKEKQLQIKKSSHMKGRERMKNCIWLLQKSAKACPQRLPAMLLVTLLDAVNAVNIILFYKYAVQEWICHCGAGAVSGGSIKANGDCGRHLSGSTCHS